MEERATPEMIREQGNKILELLDGWSIDAGSQLSVLTACINYVLQTCPDPQVRKNTKYAVINIMHEEIPDDK